MDSTPSNNVGPGILAFVAFLFLAIMLWLLMRNMNGRLRRMSYSTRAATEQEAAARQVPPVPDVRSDRQPRAGRGGGEPGKHEDPTEPGEHEDPTEPGEQEAPRAGPPPDEEDPPHGVPDRPTA